MQGAKVKQSRTLVVRTDLIYNNHWEETPLGVRSRWTNSAFICTEVTGASAVEIQENKTQGREGKEGRGERNLEFM